MTEINDITEGSDRTRQFRVRSGEITERRDERSREQRRGSDTAYLKGLGEKGARTRDLRDRLKHDVGEGINDFLEGDKSTPDEDDSRKNEKGRVVHYVASPPDSIKASSTGDRVEPKMPLEKANWINRIWNFARRGGNR